MAFSFIHAADLHLDSPFRGVTAQSERVAETLRAATFDAFDALVRLCIDRKALFLLVAGDVFDGADRGVRAQLRFRDGLAKLAEAGVRSFVVHGNHDPLSGWASSIQWPDGARVFGADAVETEIVEAGGRPVASVSGLSYAAGDVRENLAQQFLAERPGLFQIALLHCNCGGNTGHDAYAPCSLDDLAAAGFDYWALGHVHTRAVLRSDRPRVVYPGNPQGLSIREPGERGCYSVAVNDGGDVALQFHALDTTRWISREVSIEGVETIDGLDQRLADCVESIRDGAAGRHAVSRIALVGRGPLYGELNREGAVGDLLARVQASGEAGDPFVWVESIDLRCGPAIDLERRREGRDLLGQLLSIAQSMRAEGNLAEALAPALDDLHAHARARKALDELSAEEFEELLAEAESLCADLLEGGQ